VTCHASAGSRSVAAAGSAWHKVVAACLGQLEPLPAGANLGVAYFGDQLAPMADEIVRALRERTGVADWLGVSSTAVLAGRAQPHENGLAVLVTSVPRSQFCIAPSFHPPLARCGTVLAHAALDEAAPEDLLAELARNAPAELVGGLVAASCSPVHIAGDMTASSAVCLALGREVPVAAGLARACTPIGLPHRVTSAQGPLILALDGRPALEVLTEELGDLFRVAGERFAPSLWLADEALASDVPQVRRVTVADPVRGALRVAGPRLEGKVRLMRPDPAASLRQLSELARDLRARLGGREVTAGIYLASRHRGPRLFGPGVDELAVLRSELGGTPLVGLVTDAEIYRGALHETAGVLMLIGADGGLVGQAGTSA
jgi:small ligand-binding sensory domain FIST